MGAVALLYAVALFLGLIIFLPTLAKDLRHAHRPQHQALVDGRA